MRVIIAPLNWGLGHATRCAALVHRYMQQGHEVVLGGDGDSLAWLHHEFPRLPIIHLAPLRLRYSSGKNQVWAMLWALPRIIVSACYDHFLLRQLLKRETFDLIISDNRFGLYPPTHKSTHAASVRSVYITHQLHIFLPRGWKWMEPLVQRIHAAIYRHYDEVWVPDYEDTNNNLSGELSHLPISSPTPITYIGPLSRFEIPRSNPSSRLNDTYHTVAVLSGLEPQRTHFEQQLLTRFAEQQQTVLIVRGLPTQPFTLLKNDTITMVPWLSDTDMTYVLQHAEHIIARSGYSTIMDLHVLGLLDRAELHPTPGQPEQIYLKEICKYAKK